MADGTVQEVDVPYDIPESWEWVRVGNICTTNIGLTFKPSEVQETGIPVYKANNIKNGKISTLDLAFVSEKTTIKENEWLNKNDILMAVRSGSKQLVGKTAIIENLKTKTSFGAFMSVIRPISVSSTFMNYFFQSSHFRSQLDDANTTTIFQVTQKMLKETLLPLPPLAEQKRIVVQIERALEKVEAYADSYTKLQELEKAFPDKLKKSILQNAMQGKPEKQKLFEEGKLKKKDLQDVVVTGGDDNSPYGKNEENSTFSSSTIPDIPNTWRYVRFGSLVLFNIGKTPPRSEPTFWGNDISWVSISDMPNSGLVAKTKEYLSDIAIKNKNIKIAPAGTLLMSFKLSIGKVAILDIPASHNEAIISIFPYCDEENIIRDYLMRFLPLISTAGNSKDAIKGKTLNSTSISELLIPVSNFREMKDIITKVDLLFEKVAQLLH
ncbi:MAG: type I restriction endonuclease subunit S [Streptococcus pyogenes]|nr:MAG: type I restriction endonuclease subunit S [Streptococcus pyogenes]